MPDGKPNPSPAGQPDGGQGGEGGQGDPGHQDTRTPEQIAAHNAALSADIVKERERRRAAEDALKAKETADQIAAAKTAEEVERVRQQAAADIARERRTASLQVAAATAGIHDAFVTQADNGKDSVEEVVAAAKAQQDAFLKSAGQKAGTITMGGGNSPDGGGGGRVWKASDVRKLSPVEYRKHESDIKAALRDGRFRDNE